MVAGNRIARLSLHYERSMLLLHHPASHIVGVKPTPHYHRFSIQTTAYDFVKRNLAVFVYRFHPLYSNPLPSYFLLCRLSHRLNYSGGASPCAP